MKRGFLIVVIVIILLAFASSSTIKISSKANLESGSDKIRVVVVRDNIREVQEVTKNELESLVKRDDVKKVYYDYEVHADLQQAIPLVNVSLVWNQQVDSINLTGDGETICVLDTGINYSHQDLGGCFGENCKVVSGYDFVNDDSDPQDDHGHGTHVAGIISANGSIKGVAPDSRLIAMKVLNSGGGGSLYDVESAINWCVGNSSLYNISVISMSLGTSELFEDYCDSEIDISYLKTAIDNAIANNISVIVASGNNGNLTAISAPACLENSTSVADTYDANVGGLTWVGTCTDASTSQDQIVCHANRNSLLDLLAPGAMINSTWINGNYYEAGGTSMATPIVSGSFALLRQYKLLESSSITPYEIQSALNTTGKLISDGERNFSRVNLYSALLSLDNYAPLITINSPNYNLGLVQNQIFSVNLSDLQLNNVSITIWNSSEIYFNNTQEVSGIFNSTNWTLELDYGNYSWNIYSCDIRSNCNVSEDYSLEVIALITELLEPTQGSYNNTDQETFQCNASSGTNLENITFYLWENGIIAYQNVSLVNGTSNQSEFVLNFSLNGLNESDYEWNCLASTSEHATFADSNFSYEYDKTAPNITLNSPADQYSITSSSTTISFYFNLVDNFNTSYCNLEISGDSSSNTRNSSQLLNGTNMIEKIMTPGSYSWFIECYDLAGNYGNSSSRAFAIFTPPVPPSSSGGGGSSSVAAVSTIVQTPVTSSSKVYSLGESTLATGYTQNLGKSDRIYFKLSNETTTLAINNITNTNAIINISGEIYFSLNIGEEREAQIQNSTLIVKLNSISNLSANITLSVLTEAINESKVYFYEERVNYLTFTNAILLIALITAIIEFTIWQFKRGGNNAKKKRKNS